MNLPVKIYASKINFILVGGLASLGAVASLISAGISYLAFTGLFLIIGFPVLFTRLEYDDVRIKQINTFGSRKILFSDVSRYTYNDMFLIKGRRWVGLNLKSYDQEDIDSLQTHIRLQFGKESEYQKLRTAAREFLLSDLKWRDQNRKFNALVEIYDSLPVRRQD